MKRILSKRGYIFTDKKNPRNGIMSFILGVIAVVAIILALVFTYQNGGQALIQYAAAVLLALIYAIIGLALGIQSLNNHDIFKLFPILGIVFNTIAILASGVILYLGGI